jgi:hypothetical protein
MLFAAREPSDEIAGLPAAKAAGVTGDPSIHQRPANTEEAAAARSAPTGAHGRRRGPERQGERSDARSRSTRSPPDQGEQQRAASLPISHQDNVTILRNRFEDFSTGRCGASRALSCRSRDFASISSARVRRHCRTTCTSYCGLSRARA